MTPFTYLDPFTQLHYRSICDNYIIVNFHQLWCIVITIVSILFYRKTFNINYYAAEHEIGLKHDIT